jgi:hypothetical protein
MVLERGERLHIIERRYFSDDLRRHFVGEILDCTEWVVRLKGYVWVFDATIGQFVRKPERRERIISLLDRLTINVIPLQVDLDAVKYVNDPHRGLIVTDEKSFFLEITEFTALR